MELFQAASFDWLDWVFIMTLPWLNCLGLVFIMILLWLASMIGQDVSLPYLRYYLIAVFKVLRVSVQSLIPINLFGKAFHKL
jgi:hypothetical protein